VRDECARDFEATLRSVRGLGYEGVEVFDLHGHDPARVRGWLDELGLAPCGFHTSLEAVEERLPELAAEAGVLGTRRRIVSWIEPPESGTQAREAVERLRTAARKAADAGLELGFHNHAGELRPLDGGPTFLDELLGGAPELFLELDLGWAWYAGVDPAGLLERTRGRCPLVHVKDLAVRGVPTFCPVGDGAVGYERIVPAAVPAGVEWLIVEQDETEGPSLEAARRSLEALRRMLAESPDPRSSRPPTRADSRAGLA